MSVMCDVSVRIEFYAYFNWVLGYEALVQKIQSVRHVRYLLLMDMFDI